MNFQATEEASSPPKRKFSTSKREISSLFGSVADPGSGAFLTLVCGIRDGKKSRSRIRDSGILFLRA
jgi:hypothetical protein